MFIGLILLSGCAVFGVNKSSDTAGTGPNVRKQLAEQQAMIDSLQKEIQVLRGKLQENENRLKKSSKDLQEANNKIQSQFSRLDTETNSNKERIGHLEKYLNVETSEKDGFFTGSENTAGKEITENEAYALAKQKFERGDHQSARAAFKNFIEKYPTSEQADNAIFWIGETYFHEKWYEKAILEYEKVIVEYPKGNKVPAALLKQGISFYLHGETEKDEKFKETAIGVMNELIDKFPKSNEAAIASKKLKEYQKK
jgi:tol-pal system protein YbgF